MPNGIHSGRRDFWYPGENLTSLAGLTSGFSGRTSSENLFGNLTSSQNLFEPLPRIGKGVDSVRVDSFEDAFNLNNDLYELAC